PLEGMGVEIEFSPGPQLARRSLEEVARLTELDPGAVSFVAETIARVRDSLPGEVAVIGFAGGPLTLLAYLLEGSGSRDFMQLRAALHRPEAAGEALAALGRSMAVYLAAQVEAGADAVQLFDSWAGLLSRHQFERLAAPAAGVALAGLGAPSIYFVPHGPHLLDLASRVGATGYGVDWRLPLSEAWRRVGEDLPLQGNLDPAALVAGPEVTRLEARRVLQEAAGRPGHLFNLGHGIHPDTPVESVEAMVAEVREAR
ncbi:MAG: uroporphyrinogen decarboxylase family protein, partial [Acidimicrobiia bacterium]